MKVFISWSGELSNAVAQVLKKYLPCIIQNAEVFCSSEDIEKGENWDSRLTSELASSCFGIVCLTPSNMNASWINFEAGAIAKTLNSRMTALMINLKPSDIQGPLKRYQATNLDERDMKKLILDINKASDDPRDEAVINESFDAFWPKIEAATKEALQSFNKDEVVKKTPSKSPNDVAIEEILQLTRKQTLGINSLENLIQRVNFPSQSITGFEFDRQLEMIDYARMILRRTINKARSNESLKLLLAETDIELVYSVLNDIIYRSKREMERSKNRAILNPRNDWMSIESVLRNEIECEEKDDQK